MLIFAKGASYIYANRTRRPASRPDPQGLHELTHARSARRRTEQLPHARLCLRGARELLRDVLLRVPHKPDGIDGWGLGRSEARVRGLVTRGLLLVVDRGEPRIRVLVRVLEVLRLGEQADERREGSCPVARTLSARVGAQERRDGDHHDETLGSVTMIALCVSMRVRPTTATFRFLCGIFGICEMTKFASTWDHRLRRAVGQ